MVELPKAAFNQISSLTKKILLIFLLVFAYNFFLYILLWRGMGTEKFISWTFNFDFQMDNPFVINVICLLLVTLHTIRYQFFFFIAIFYLQSLFIVSRLKYSFLKQALKLDLRTVEMIKILRTRHNSIAKLENQFDETFSFVPFT